jgi:uncharacterized membrane protein YidH (DUF202 family)
MHSFTGFDTSRNASESDKPSVSAISAEQYPSATIVIEDTPQYLLRTAQSSVQRAKRSSGSIFIISCLIWQTMAKRSWSQPKKLIARSSPIPNSFTLVDLASWAAVIASAILL